MTGPRIQTLDDLGAEFARVAAERERPARRPFPSRVASRTVALALTAVVLVAGGAYAVPATRAAIDDLTATFAGWVAGDEARPPGRALRPADDAPAWVREEGGRLIAENAGVGLYVSRVDAGRGPELRFALGDAMLFSGSVESWRGWFDRHAAVVFGATNFGRKRGGIDEHGRFPLVGVTARSVDRLELRYADDGPPLAAVGVDGGFVMLADAWRPLRELVAYDVQGRELERVDVDHIDLRYLCERERGCPAQ